MNAAEIGVIGGSGLYDMTGLRDVKEIEVKTPYGAPSDRLRVGQLGDRRVAFLARHGRGHRLLPGEINFRANIHAMKQLGVERLISASAVGSLKEEIHPLDIVLPDQFFDRTQGRRSTFFGDGIVAHVTFGDPVCAELLSVLRDSAPDGKTLHRGGTYVCMEGPQFSTRAESNFYRSLGASVIGMTNLQEAKLAREAELCFAVIALATDYDCWHEEEHVNVETIVRRLHENAAAAQRMIATAVARLPAARSCGCGRALENGILTPREHIGPDVRERLRFIIGKYIGEPHDA